AFKRDIDLNFAAEAPQHDVLAALWARTKIDDLMSQDWRGTQTGTPVGQLREQITQLGLDYRLMTQFTSFVAVEERTVMQDGKPRRVQVPVEMPEGVSYQGIMGDDELKLIAVQSLQMSTSNAEVSGFSGRISGITGARTRRAAPVGIPKLAVPPPAPPSSGAAMSVAVDGAATLPTKPTKPADKEHALLESKFRPEVIALYDCWKQNSTGTPCKLPKDEMVALPISVIDSSATTIQQLRALGLHDITQPRAKLVLGKIRIDRLLKLAELKEVQFASLQK